MQSQLELDDLKLALKTLEQRLERQTVATRDLALRSTLVDVRASLRPLVVGQTVQLLGGLLLALVFGPVWMAHRGEPRVMTYALALHGYGLILSVLAVNQLLRIVRIDYSSPVLEVQRRLQQLAVFRLRSARWLVVTGCLMWVPLLLLMFSWVGIDPWVTNRAMVYWNIASALLCVALCYGLVCWSKRPGKERWADYLRRSVKGRSLERAEAALAALDDFER